MDPVCITCTKLCTKFEVSGLGGFEDTFDRMPKILRQINYQY